ncbi:MAG: tripartite tricarboxylate transporter substrate binding protein [Candidatus Accumulibacter sp.]|jgi:tripartite-type tricarboxylate transporter receptor subunit TctC|nr:tripartite tricarboxylate transporter substrate binding protein [Accumulibacter sp.]
MAKVIAKKLLALVCMFAVFGNLVAVPARAAYPEKPVLTIVPFSPGGGNDILMRLVAKHINETLGQSLTVENKPGAGGQVGWTALANARPDGYTIGSTSLPSMILVKSLRENVPFSLDDFKYICNFQVDPVIWVVQKESRLNSAKAVVDFAKANPKKLNVAGDGPQSNIQLQHLVASKLLDIETNFVPYNGSGPALTALLGGKVDIAVSTLSAAVSHIESGRIVPLVLFYDNRMDAIKGTPVAKEAFGKDIPSVGMSLRGVAAPKGVPDEQIAVLEKAFKKVAESKEFLEQAKGLGLTIDFIGAANTTKLIQDSIKLVEEYKSLF